MLFKNADEDRFCSCGCFAKKTWLTVNDPLSISFEFLPLNVTWVERIACAASISSENACVFRKRSSLPRNLRSKSISHRCNFIGRTILDLRFLLPRSLMNGSRAQYRCFTDHLLSKCSTQNSPELLYIFSVGPTQPLRR